MPELPRYTLKDVAQKHGRDGSDIWIVINDLVYDVTSYKVKHPGGVELIEEYAGQDATRGFEEFGHSSDARRIMKKFLVGELEEQDKMSNRNKKDVTFHENGTKVRNGRRRILAVLCGKCAT